MNELDQIFSQSENASDFTSGYIDCLCSVLKQRDSHGVVAFDGGKLRKECQKSVHIPINKGEYGPAVDGLMILDHILGSYLTRIVQDGAK
jgi:hypothetical protein